MSTLLHSLPPTTAWDRSLKVAVLMGGIRPNAKSR